MTDPPCPCYCPDCGKVLIERLPFMRTKWALPILWVMMMYGRLNIWWQCRKLMKILKKVQKEPAIEPLRAWKLPKMETEQDVADVLDTGEKALQKALPGGKITKIKIE